MEWMVGLSNYFLFEEIEPKSTYVPTDELSISFAGPRSALVLDYISIWQTARHAG